MDANLAEQLTGILGDEAVSTDGYAFAVDGLRPACVAFPDSLDALRRCVAAGHAAGAAMLPIGNGTHLAVGAAPRRYDLGICVRRMARIIAHEPADMTVTVEAGITLAELNLTLAAAGQRLPLDPPRPSERTIGGIIAGNASGALRLSNGTVRDLLIGITAVLADGTVVHGGGRVVKNVAGYDLMKVFTGSLGTLGIIAEATFKLRPYPRHECVVAFSAASVGAAVAAADHVLDAAVAPLFVVVLNAPAVAMLGIGDGAPAVFVGCGSSLEEVEVQRARLAQLVAGELRVSEGQDAARVAVAIRDVPVSATTPRDVLGVKLAVPPVCLGDVLGAVEDDVSACGATAALVALPGVGTATIRIRGLPPDAVAACAARLRARAAAAGGYAVLDVVPPRVKSELDVWGPVPGIALMRGVKQALDPSDQLSPGRFVGGI